MVNENPVISTQDLFNPVITPQQVIASRMTANEQQNRPGLGERAAMTFASDMASGISGAAGNEDPDGTGIGSAIAAGLVDAGSWAVRQITHGAIPGTYQGKPASDFYLPKDRSDPRQWVPAPINASEKAADMTANLAEMIGEFYLLKGFGNSAKIKGAGVFEHLERPAAVLEEAAKQGYKPALKDYAIASGGRAASDAAVFGAQAKVHGDPVLPAMATGAAFGAMGGIPARTTAEQAAKIAAESGAMGETEMQTTGDPDRATIAALIPLMSRGFSKIGKAVPEAGKAADRIIAEFMPSNLTSESRARWRQQLLDADTPEATGKVVTALQAEGAKMVAKQQARESILSDANIADFIQRDADGSETDAILNAGTSRSDWERAGVRDEYRDVLNERDRKLFKAKLAAVKAKLDSGDMAIDAVADEPLGPDVPLENRQSAPANRQDVLEQVRKREEAEAAKEAQGSAQSPDVPPAGVSGQSEADLAPAVAAEAPVPPVEAAPEPVKPTNTWEMTWEQYAAHRKGATRGMWEGVIKKAMKANKPVPADLKAEVLGTDEVGDKAGHADILRVHERYKDVVGIPSDDETPDLDVTAVAQDAEHPSVNGQAWGYTFTRPDARREVASLIPKEREYLEKRLSIKAPDGGSRGDDLVNTIGAQKMVDAMMRYDDIHNPKRKVEATVEWMEAHPDAWSSDPDAIRAYSTWAAKKQGLKARKGTETHVAEQLPVGTTLKIGGNPLKVTSQDDGGTRIEDHITVDVPPGVPLIVDKGTIHKAKVETGDTSFDFGSNVSKTEPTPALKPETTQVTPVVSPENKPKGLFGQQVTDPLTGEQGSLEFTKDTDGNTMTGAGWKNKQGKMIAERDAEAEAAQAANDAANGQGMLPGVAAGPSTVPHVPLNQPSPPPPPTPAPAKASGPLKPGQKVSIRSIIETAAKLFKVQVRSGKVPANVSKTGMYKGVEEVVRTMFGDLGTVAHEIGHHIWQTMKIVQKMPVNVQMELSKLDYDPQQQRTHEGFGEFIRHLWTTGEAKQRAPLAYEWFTQKMLPKNPEVAAKFDRILAMMNRYRLEMTPAERAASQIATDGKPDGPVTTFGEWVQDSVNRAFQTAYVNLVDSGHMLNEWVKDARAAGYNVPKGDDPYTLLRAYTQAGPTFAFDAIANGVMTISKGQNYRLRIGPSIRDVVKLLKPDELKSQDFQVFALAMHTLESLKAGEETGIAKEDAESVIQNHGTAEQRARWTEAANNLFEFNNALTAMLADAGVVTSKEAAQIVTTYSGMYLPMNRVGDWVKGRQVGLSKKFVNLPPAFRKRVGSNRQFLDPIQATMMRSIELYQRAWQQQVTTAMWEMSKVHGQGKWMEEVPADRLATVFNINEIRAQLEKAGVDSRSLKNVDPKNQFFIYRNTYDYKGGDPIVRVNVGGKPKMVYIDRDLYKMLMGMNTPQLPWFLDLTLGKMTRLAKMGITGLNPEFAARNIFKDFTTWLMQQNEGSSAKMALDPFAMIGKYISSWANGIQGKPQNAMVRLWMDNGGPLGTFLGLDRKSIQKTVTELMEDGTKARALGIVRHPIDALRDAIGVSEVGPRLATFRKVLERYGFTEESLSRPGAQQPPRHVIAEALRESNDVTTDFRRAGVVGKWINQVCPFFNPSVQGLDKYIRTWKGNPKQTAIRAAAMASSTLVYWMMVKDQDWYKEAPDWLKYGFWTVTDTNGKPVARVPRAFEWGWTVSAGVEAAIDAAYRKDPAAFASYLASALKQNIPIPEPAGMDAALKAANWDTFRWAPVDPPSLMSRKPEDRYTPYTTMMMRGMGQILGVSPNRMEAVVDSLTGGMYRRASYLAQDVGSLATGKLPPSSDVPFAGGLMFKRDYTKSTDAFYNALNEAEQAYKSAKMDGVPSAEVENTWKRLSDVNEMVGKINRLRPDTRNRDQRFEIERYVTGVMRWALGEPELERYPNPLDVRNVPGEIRPIVAQYIGNLRRREMAPVPSMPSSRDGQLETFQHFDERRRESIRAKSRAADDIARLPR